MSALEVPDTPAVVMPAIRPQKKVPHCNELPAIETKMVHRRLQHPLCKLQYTGMHSRCCFNRVKKTASIKKMPRPSDQKNAQLARASDTDDDAECTLGQRTYW